jgi:hypothetical protein
MSALIEAKRFVGLHARHMGLRPGFVADVLRRVEMLDGDGPRSWVHEWSKEAEAAARRSDGRVIANLYNLARFPCADTEAKLQAGRLAAEALGGWLAASGAGERRTARVDGSRVPFLFRAGPDADAPLVVLMGGIVSLKEQWGGFLALGRRLGCAIAIADFPGVGENPVRYTRGAAEVFGAIMDAVDGDCWADRTLIVAPSFGGHLAMLQSLLDDRVCGVVTVGAPITRFFQDEASRRGMPEITRAALMRSIGADGDAGFDRSLAGLALHEREVAELSVDVTYVASLKDEIIPQRDWQDAALLNEQLRVYAFEDVHGAPHHLRQTRLLILSALLRHAGRARLARGIELILRRVLRAKPYRSPFA